MWLKHLEAQEWSSWLTQDASKSQSTKTTAQWIVASETLSTTQSRAVRSQCSSMTCEAARSLTSLKTTSIRQTSRSSAHWQLISYPRLLQSLIAWKLSAVTSLTTCKVGCPTRIRWRRGRVSRPRHRLCAMASSGLATEAWQRARVARTAWWCLARWPTPSTRSCRRSLLIRVANLSSSLWGHSSKRLRSARSRCIRTSSTLRRPRVIARMRHIQWLLRKTRRSRIEWTGLT